MVDHAEEHGNRSAEREFVWRFRKGAEWMEEAEGLT